jgi:ABC-type nitrate/sulfonate/bicarbonate transport system substrate-binding protein
MRRTYAILAGVAVLAATTWWFNRSITITRTPVDRAMRPVVWGGPKNISMLPILAEQQGFFKAEGLDARPNYVQTGKIAMDAVVSRDLQLGVIVDVNIGFVKFQDGANVAVVAGVMDKFDDAIVARKDMGIEKPQDLEGKELAILPGTTSHRFADLFIDFYKLDRSRIKILNLAPPAIQASLLSRQIPAGSVWQPFRYNVQQQLGDKAVQMNDRRIYRSRCLLAVRTDFAGDYRAEIRAFLRALIKAEGFARNNRETAIGILARELSMEPTILAAVWDEYILGVTLDPALPQVFSDTGAWVVRSQKGFEGRQVPSYADVVDPSFLKEVAPQRLARSAG